MTKFFMPPAALDQHVAILGKTRGGKTNTAKVCIEQLVAAGGRVCVIDPIKSDYWGLISSADGKHPGLPFHIIGGPHGHVPLHASAGKAIAGVVASGALPLSIIDMEAFGPQESGPFFADFMSTVFREIRGILHIVVDEAHLFAPKEKLAGGKESMSSYWFKRMAGGSGSKGVRLIVSTQRLQELHNTVLSNCETLFAHRITFPADQKVVSDWLASNGTKEQVAEVKTTLANLKRGEAWMCSGELDLFQRVTMPLCATYDNSRTPTADDKGHKPVKTATIDLDKLKGLIGDAVKEAEDNDPKLLKAKLRELEKKLATQLQVAAAPAKETKTVTKTEYKEVPLFQPAEFKKLAADITELLTRADQLRHFLNTLVVRTEGGRQLVAGLCAAPAKPVTQPAPRQPRSGYAVTSVGFNGSSDKPVSTDGLTAAQMRVLRSFYWLKDEEATPVKVAFFANYTVNGHFNNLCGSLRTMGLVAGWQITEAGIAMIPADVESKPVGEQLLHWLQAKLTPAHNKLVDVLYAARGERVPLADLAEGAGYTINGHFNNLLGKLRSLDVADGGAKEGGTRLNKIFFE